MNEARARRVPATVPPAGHARRGHGGHAAPRPAFGARDARRPADDGRGDRDVRTPPAALVRSRSRHAGADGRDRARGAAPRVGAPARVDRRREGGSASAGQDLLGDAANGCRRNAAPTTSCRGSGSRRPKRRRPETTRSGSPTTNASSWTRASPTEMPRYAAERMRHERELTLERRARTRLRGLVAVLAAALLVAASLTAVAVNRSREAQRRSDEATDRRPSPEPRCRTSTAIPSSASCLRFTRSTGVPHAVSPCRPTR